MSDKKTRVLIVDDSAVVRKMLTEILGSADDLEVVGTASDPLIARQKIKQLQPDVLTLDIEMPRMDGLTFLRNIMRLRPMPVVMISTLTERGAEVTLEALEVGAIDYVSKPKLDLGNTLGSYTNEILTKVRTASKSTPRGYASKVVGPDDRQAWKKGANKIFSTTGKLIAIGASTGGVEALREVISAMPADAPGIVVAQHIPAAFSESFAARLDDTSAVRVRHARDRDQILPGHVYIAPGDHHLEVVRSGARYHCRVHQGDRVNRHRPSVDVLFQSVAENVGQNAVGAILTGMGADGAKGLLSMREAGCTTIAQDEATSVVWGMPGSAVKIGAAIEIVPLGRVTDCLLQSVAKIGKR